jgi:nucleotide-binding universal stress UspA family protein
MSAYPVCPTARIERLLLATDGSKMSDGAIKEAVNLAKTCSSKLFVLAVVEINPEFEAYAPGILEKMEKETRKHLDSIKSQASKEGVNCVTIAHEGNEPFQYIIDEAAKNKVEIILMGRHGRTGLKRLLMGSVTARVIGHSPCKVMIVPEGTEFACKKILIATDGSKYSEAASREAISIAKRCGSDLIVLSVATKEKNLPAAKKSVDKISNLAKKEDIKVDTLTLRGMPYEVIVKTAEKKKADVIVVGSHGRTGLKRVLMGSVTERVIGHAKCAVLVMKA